MPTSIQLLCSTGAFSRFPDQTGYQAVLDYGPQLEVDGFELMFYPNWYSQGETIGRALKASGLAFPVMHTDKDIGTAFGKVDQETQRLGLARLEENCQLGKIIGTRLLVLHLWGWPELDDCIERNLALLSACLDLAARYDMELAIETIPCRQATPLHTVLAAIEHDSRSQVTLDTEFLFNHQQLDEAFLKTRLWNEQRVRHVHIKDSNGSPFTSDGLRQYLHPGDGHIDFAAFFTLLQRNGFSGSISLEAPALGETGEVRLKQLHTSLAFLRRLIG